MQNEDLPRAPWTCRWGAAEGLDPAEPEVLRQAPWTCSYGRLSTSGGDSSRHACLECPCWEPVARADRPVRTMVAVQRLSLDDWKCLTPAAVGRAYERGDVLVHEGPPVRTHWFILAGRVKVGKLTPTGREVCIEILGPGDIVNMPEGCEAEASPVRAVALERTACAVIPHRELASLLQAHPWLARGLFHGLTLRVMHLMDRAAEVSGGRVEQRFARLFLRLADESGRTGRPVMGIPYLSRQDLAALTGTTVETSIRVMCAWKRRNLVRTRPGRFVIVDRSTLEVLAL